MAFATRSLAALGGLTLSLTAPGLPALANTGVTVTSYGHSALLVQGGGAVIDGIPVRWGVYAGGVQIDPFHGAINAQFFHFMAVPSITPVSVLQQTGSATFNTVVGFTRPVDEQARIGGTASLIPHAAPAPTAAAIHRRRR